MADDDSANGADGAEVSFEILGTQSAQPGWYACYLTAYDQVTRTGKFVSLPVVLWVTVAKLGDDNTQEQSVRPFVARTNGAIIDYEQPEHPFICLVRPGDDADRVVQAVLAQEDTVVVLRGESPPS